MPRHSWLSGLLFAVIVSLGACGKCPPASGEEPLALGVDRGTWELAPTVADHRMYASLVGFPTTVVSNAAPVKQWHYNPAFLFALTREVASAEVWPGLKPLLFLVTFPADALLLPVAAIGGLFG